MGQYAGEDPDKLRRFKRRTWSLLVGGLVLLLGGSVVVAVAEASAQRLVLGAVAVPLAVSLAVHTVHEIRRERREGPRRASPEAARRLPLLVLALLLFGWGSAFVGFQFLLPKPLDSALVFTLPFAISPLAGVVDVWKLRRSMTRAQLRDRAHLGSDLEVGNGS